MRAVISILNVVCWPHLRVSCSSDPSLQSSSPSQTHMLLMQRPLLHVNWLPWHVLLGWVQTSGGSSLPSPQSSSPSQCQPAGIHRCVVSQRKSSKQHVDMAENSIGYDNIVVTHARKTCTRLVYQKRCSSDSGIALSRSPLPARGTVYRRLSHQRRHCRLSNDIWRHTCLRPRTDGAADPLVSFSVYRTCRLCVLRVLAVFGLNATLIF